MKRIGIIGAGTMGIDVTIDALFHEFQVVLVDINNTALKSAKKKIVRTLRMGTMISQKFGNYSKDYVNEHLVITQNIDDVKKCNVIVENICEKFEEKEKVYCRLNEICTKDTLFVCNTSCIPITCIAKNVENPKRVIGVHFMNPAYLKTTVEVIRGYYTDDDCVGRVKKFIGQFDKKCIVVNDCPGFVSNRISHLLMNEAAYTVMDGVATVQQVDDIFKQCFGHKMGPFETADLIGIDVVVDSLDILYECYHDSKFRCCPLFKKMVGANLLGRKSGKGFYNY